MALPSRKTDQIGATPANSRTISVLIADDHDLIREALAQVLVTRAGFVVDQASTMQETLTAIDAKGGYDVLLLDINMPGVSGMEGIKRAIIANHSGAVVVFSGNVTQEFVTDALELGARGYIPKTLPLKSLVTSVELIASGQVFFPLTFIRGATTKTEPEKSTLNANEIRILRLVSEGLTNKEIAWKFNMSEVTIKMHMRSICAKLNASNRTQAAMIGSQAGIL